MKSLTKNQLAAIEGGIPACPQICYQAMSNYWIAIYTNNPLLLLLASKILNSKKCQYCELD